MGYNVLSGSTSVINVISSGSFIGDGSGLENVEQFPLQNAVVTRIPFYKTIGGELGLNANSGFTFDASANALTVPGLTSSVGIKLVNPLSRSLAGDASYLGVDANGNLVVTSSGISYGRRQITSNATASAAKMDNILQLKSKQEIAIFIKSPLNQADLRLLTVKVLLF